MPLGNAADVRRRDGADMVGGAGAENWLLIEERKGERATLVTAPPKGSAEGRRGLERSWPEQLPETGVEVAAGIEKP